jgi:hypothetical protein|tara:strand:+ start:1927 stop:3417 length:1491 start_codon:yes stop_codon:yes gene_type:complete
MAYFNHAFNKTFIADSTLATAGTATSALTAGQVALVSDATWASVALPGAPGIGALGYVVQGSFYTKDTIGNNPGHGGYQESVKSKGINPRYITRLWQANCQTATQATASLSLGSACAPCGKTQFMRIDVKGSPALRFLNHNAYAIADSANVCCIDGQEYIDPTLILGVMAEMALSDPLIKPFVAEGDLMGVETATLSGGVGYSVTTGAASAATTVSPAGGSGAKVNILTVSGTGVILTYSFASVGKGYAVGDVLSVVDSGSTTDATLTITALTAGGIISNSTNAAGAVTQGVYTIAQAQGKAASGNYVPSTDPNGTVKVTATVEFVGAYVDTVFGNCSFDTRDHYNAEPVEIIVSELDETGNPCNDCGVATQTPGSMQQTQGEEVVRELIMSERYRQSPYNQGNKDSARFREIEMSDELLSSVDRSATYKGYYIQHSVPRFNNPSGVFDNDQYVYKVYVKCSDAAAQTEVEKLMDALAAWATANGNALAVEENAYW